MAPQAALSRDDLVTLIDRFVDSFNQNDLNAVMRHFTDNAHYVTYDGKSYRGKPQIRKALEPQFRGDFGRIEFITEERILDEEAGRAILTWSCRHDLEQGGEIPGLAQARNILFRGVYGRIFIWKGLDILTFEGSLIREKRTYTQAHIPLGRSG